MKQKFLNDTLQHVTRFEVIDDRPGKDSTGRSLVAHNVRVSVSLQDNERTLKVFLSEE